MQDGGRTDFGRIYMVQVVCADICLQSSPNLIQHSHEAKLLNQSRVKRQKSWAAGFEPSTYSKKSSLTIELARAE